MKKVCIFGANGQTGVQVLERSLHEGLDVRACVRDKKSIAKYSDKVEVKEYSFDDYQSVSESVNGCNIIVSAIGSGSYSEAAKPTDLYSSSARAIIKAMEENEVKRLLVISSAGTEDNKKAPWYYKYLLRRYFMNSYMDMMKMETVLEEAADYIHWTIVRPTYLQDGDSKPYLAENRKLLNGDFKINRIDVADFMVKEMLNNDYIHQYPVLGYK